MKTTRLVGLFRGGVSAVAFPLALVLSGVLPAAAATSSGGLRVEVITAYNLVVDSNAGTPSSHAPRSAYVGVTFHNDGSQTLSNLMAYIGSYNGGTNSTPGICPSRVHPGLTGPLAGGAFALRHEGGRAGASDATRYLPSIPAGQSVTIYWLIGYDQVDIYNVPLWGKSVKPDDDLWLTYDIWASAREGVATRNVDLTRTVHFRNEISAEANKIFPNGANKVPDYYKELLNQYVPAWTNSNQDGTVGTRIVTEGIWYDLGNVGVGFDNDGDFVPDHNAWMQPIGDPSLYDAGAFRLIKTYAMVVVKLIGGGEVVYTAEDQLYFEHIPDNNGAVGYVRYDFMPLLPRARSVTTPYQEVASGYDNEKFNADYGVALGNDLISGEARVTLDKTADRATVSPGGTIAYSVTFTNFGTVATGDPGLGLAMVVQDSVPAGTVYVAGSAEAANAPPAGSSGYTIFYSTNNGTSWSLTEPPAVSVTDVQWWLRDALPAGGSGVVRLSVTVDNPYTQPSPLIENEAGTSFGNDPPFDTDTTTTLVLGNNRLGDTVFADTGVGAGGALANGIQDGSEPGIPGVTVYLYADDNGNGVADAWELLIGTTETGANGVYYFSNLADGRYAVEVDTADSSIPFGYTVTTPAVYGIDLDSAHATTGSVENLTADFGFAPALLLTKTRNGAGALREGTLVTYTLSVTNRLPGDGSAAPQPFRYTVWPTNAVTDSQANRAWLNYLNAAHAGEPDGQYATGPFENTVEWMATTNYASATWPGSITNVTLLVPMLVTGSFDPGDGTLDVEVRHNGALLGSVHSYDCSVLSSSTLVLDITADKAGGWAWSNFNNRALSVNLIARKHGNPGGDLGVDSVGFRVTTDELVGGTDSTTLDPVPLFDTFDVSRLRFLSSQPPADGVATNGLVGRISWNDVGPLYAGGIRNLSLTFKVLEPPGNVSAPLTNSASITNAWFMSGRRANDQYATNIATVVPAGTIGDFVWRDLDGQGDQDAGEPGVANVTVTITPPAGVDLGNGPGVASNGVTDANGYYLFEALPASGNYTVTVVASTLPGGTGTPTWDYDGIGTPHTAVVPLTVDATNGADKVLTADFGYTLAATIRGTIWHDEDRDGSGAPEDGDDRMTNVTVRLYASDGVTLLATTNTSAAGTFVFYGGFNGTYVVRAVTNTGSLASGTWIRSFDTDGISSSNQVTLAVPSGGLGTADFSYYLTGALRIGDTVFYDWNGNGIQDSGSDEGIDGVTVRLYQDEDGDGVVDAGTDGLLATATTATNGVYLFQNLPAGRYQVVVDGSSPALPPLYVITADPYGAKDGISVVTLTTADNLDQDFGYRPFGYGSIGDTVWYDSNGDGVQLGLMETGISNVTVRLYADLDGDGSYFLVRTATTDSDGKYLFSSLPDGDYRVTVDAASPALPTDDFGQTCRATTPTTYETSLAGNAFLTADFGFVLPGVIGDTVYWDYNGNAEQDWTEPGIPGVTVNLYRDANSNRVYDVGEPLVGTLVTDASGKYDFTGLLPNLYVVVVDASSPALSGATLTGDPTNDGVPCPIPAVPGPSCDGACGVRLTEESIFLGADFGYRPPGSIGDTVWFDTNTNGVRDAGEIGIPYVTVELLTNGVVMAATLTDPDGIYGFGGLADGTYVVRVVPTNAVFAGSACTYDADGAPDSIANAIVISGQHVTSIGGQSVTNADLDIDFGYHRAGNNALSGTVGLDAMTYDGLLNGANPSGVASNESPFAGVSVYLTLWSDDGDGAVEPGETQLIDTKLTASNGDYAFTGLPSGSGTNDHYVVSLSAPAEHLLLTTTASATGAQRLVNATNSVGESLSVYQVFAIVPVRTNADFAFAMADLTDFGDLPVSYSTVVGDVPVGPSHRVPLTPTLYLGAGVDTEPNGQPTADATGDGADEDGVTPVGIWREGAAGAQVQVQVGAGSGWLVGYIDFDRDGSFLDIGEMVVTQQVSATGGNGSGLYTFNIDVPAGTFSMTGGTSLKARFRLMPEAALLPELAFAGYAAGGEVEDYSWDLSVIGDQVWEDVDGNGAFDAGEPVLTNVTVFLDLDSDGIRDAGEPYAVSDTNGVYGIAGLPSGTYTVRVDTATLPAGLLPCYDLTPPADSVAVVALGANEARLDVDFGYSHPGALGDFVWEDLDADGIQDVGEPGLTNIVVRLYDAGSSLLATTATGPGGGYLFTNVTAGAYFVRFTPPVGYVFSPQGAGGNAALDSNPAGDGWTGTNALTSGQTNLTVDAGLYVPARIHGYAFMDDVYDLVRVPAQDGPVSNMLVWLLHNGVAIATNRTDANGFYQFTGIVPGTYTVLFDCNPPTLIAVPTEQPAASDPERNRAQSTTGSDAWIVHTVASGDGVLPGRFDEPLNAGFTGNPMAAAVNIVAYAGANGVVIEFTTDEEAGTHDIVLYAWLGGEWVEVARQAAVGEGSNRYAFDALPMLRSGQRYDFRIVDDEGRPHNVAGLEVAAFRAKAVRMVKDGVWIEFASLPDRTYDVYRASSPAAPDEAWTLVGTVTAIERTTRTVVPVDPAARQGFFRVKMR